MLNRRAFLMSAAAALGVPSLTYGQSGDGTGPKLIVILAEGGWDVTFLHDPKLHLVGSDDSPIEGPEVDQKANEPEDREAVQTFGELPIVVNNFKRPAVTEFFQNYGHRAHIVNGVWTGSIAHDPCRYRILTGTPDGTKPDMASITGSALGGALPLGAVDLSGWSITGNLAATTGRIGHQSQIKALIDPETKFRAPPSGGFNYPIFELDESSDAEVEAYLLQRAEQFRETAGSMPSTKQHIDDLVSSLDRGRRFREQSQDILSSLTLGRRAGLVSQLEIAVNMLDEGLCHAVTIDTRQSWDSHQNNEQQHGFYQNTFEGLNVLAAELEARGALDDTVVVVVSEMTRTPLRNAANGKDHWGHTSALLFGGPVKGGRATGATDNLLESLPMDLATGVPFLDREEGNQKGALCKYDNLVAGVLEMCGVDPEPWLPGVVPFRGMVA